ncbi:MAG: YidC/Oxa1 family membrane protein insertase [Meiothermus sp.]|uniref:YidC/Oxa1 family membrane protein insertase n=1 Tax=Meiothermus sp. TaxID=1955249 RepID=UPI0025F11CA3|nr:YidC/Oxa1 family membrane protein insertase [Meiothermus sp.]MCS7194636.1 YidC/Oxa1 family membrane protein insertase [Meiothermus sp.]MDW8090955.1 YidC/Oxa1 family membrane protein insertase [Meiothermus sp.]MDW8481849.1 YidC/Oxa1 family membrane protein insertase [Meiothermus sp.]
MRPWFWMSLVFFALAPVLALTPEWREVDVDKDGRPEKVAVTNLADVAFNLRGQIVGWYVKTARATDFRGNYERAHNLVRPGQTLPGTLEGFVPTAFEFTRREASNPDADFIATFTDGSTRLTYIIHPRFLTLDVEVESPTPRKLIWTGIGGTDTPITKWLGQGNAQPINAGQGPAVYVGWQTQKSSGFAMFLRPQEPTPISMTQLNGAGIAEVSLPPGRFSLKVYGGLNELVRLHVEGFYQLPGVFQPNIWGQVSLGLIWALEQAHRLAGGSWILAILIVTVAIRLLMWPLMHQQFKSIAEMQKIQPLIKKIQEKYKDNREKQQEEMMKLYQEHRINPLGGCFPILLQMPILFLMYKVMVGYEFGQGFLWIRDLALPDPLYILPFLYILVLLASTWLSAAGNKDALRQGILINLVFAFILFSFPAGVTLYWLVSTLIGVGQQWLINKQLGLPLAPAKG